MLSPREIEYCKYFIEYKGDNQKIVDKMCISWRTGKCHLHSIYTKLLINDKAQLMHYLFTQQWKNQLGLSLKDIFKITKSNEKLYNLEVFNMQKFIRYILQFGGNNENNND